MFKTIFLGTKKLGSLPLNAPLS